MSLNSVNTNVGAMVALQNLNKTSSELGTVQGRINTGQKVSSAKDNGAIWAIAQGMRAESSTLNAVKDSLMRGQSTIDVALAAGESVSDLLIQMKEKALAASDPSLDSSNRLTVPLTLALVALIGSASPAAGQSTAIAQSQPAGRPEQATGVDRNLWANQSVVPLGSGRYPYTGTPIWRSLVSAEPPAASIQRLPAKTPSAQRPSAVPGPQTTNRTPCPRLR